MLARYAKGASALAVPDSGCLVVVGNLDGVHRGHVHLVEDAAAEAKRRGLLPVILTFEPHPAEVIHGRPVQRLTTPERRFELLARIDPSISMVVEPFSPELAALEPETFVRGLLVEQLRAREVLVGANFRFGHQRRGDVALLQQLGKLHGFRARAVSLSGDARGPYSSSRARTLLQEGHLAELRDVLGRPHSVSGRVVHGQHLGRTLGFPTANLERIPEALPPTGVYACLVEEPTGIGEAQRLGAAAVNVGFRPTVDATASSVEAHLLDFSGNLYGRQLRVHFERRLRDEIRFASLEELAAAIADDVDQTRADLGERMRDTGEIGPWY